MAMNTETALKNLANAAMLLVTQNQMNQNSRDRKQIVGDALQTYYYWWMKSCAYNEAVSQTDAATITELFRADQYTDKFRVIISQARIHAAYS